jgi:serine/threonine protein kinase
MPPRLHENTIVAGRYRLNRIIGRGGMGAVWHATNLGLDVPCAVKFIDAEMVHIPEALQRFEREAKAAAQIRSPNVVNILEHGMHDGVPFIAMELLDGEDLGKRISRVLKMPPREVASIVTQVCRALQRAHALEIVHRDLKPDNIFLVRDDDREIAKVLDFGIAKRTSMTLGEGDSNTKTGAMLGTPYYMSPEQAQGLRTIDYRSDLWSIAVITFRCITGVLPFRSEALGDLLVKVIVQPLPVPSKTTVGIPPAFDAWWARAAERDPAKRFQSAKELAESLALALGVSQFIEAEDRASRTSSRLRHAPMPSMSSSVRQRDESSGSTESPMSRSYGQAGPIVAKKESSNGFSGFVLGLLAAAAIAGGFVLLRGRVTFEWDKPAHPVSVESAEDAAVPVVAVASASASAAPRPKRRLLPGPKPAPKPTPAATDLGASPSDAGADAP